jgi:hypothetical protein
MGRFADGLYGSDSTLDYFAKFTNKFEHELDYWFSPQNVFYGSWWLVQVLSVLEMILLFEAQDMGRAVYLEEKSQVLEKWRKIFFDVWDGDWKDSHLYDNPCNDAAYRQQHRCALVAMFDRLDSIVQYLVAASDNNPRPELAPLHPDYPLPYFSVTRLKYDDSKEVFRVERFISDLLEWLVKEIIYRLSAEKRAELEFDVEEVWVAVDVFGFLCEKYKQSPGINERFIRIWRETTMDIGKQNVGDAWNESYLLYRDVMSVFDRMEAVARKYPPMEW